MKQLDIVILNPTGLHARPAKIFVKTAKQFKADIRVQHGEKKANAKSLISMLTLGVETKSEIRITTDGVDEEAALAALETAVRDGLGEGEHIANTQKQVPANGHQPTEPPVANGAVTVAANQIQGVAAAPGIAIGPVYQFKQSELAIEDTFSGYSEEETRLQKAIERARTQLVTLHQQMQTRQANAEAAIFDVHLEILDDPDLLDAVLAKVHNEQSAARAWQETIDARAKLVAGLGDPLLAARSADLHDVGYRVLRLLVGSEERGVQLPDHPVIIMAHDLSPSDTASLDKDKVLGFCTAVGGPTAHSAIIARALSLPAIVSCGDGVLAIADGTLVVLNGSTGMLDIAPDETAVKQAREVQQRWLALRDDAEKHAAEPAVTQDGHRVEIVANVGGVADTEQAMESGAEGVGLLRTEFLFLDRTEAPSEEEQFVVYRDIVKAMQGQPVIVRTLDIGGDKPLPYINVPPEANPFLGERGIRLCLNRPELLRQQLRAVLRASEFGKVLIMFPMISDVAEFRRARQMVEEVRTELSVPPVAVGIMVEVPSAALMADAFAQEVDFFSVGTNDLTQYTLAMDRMHPSLAAQSDGLHPAVLRLIKQTVTAAHAAGKWVGICGELGSDPKAVPILIGLGVDELSVSVPAIPSVKAQVRSLQVEEAKSLAQRALNCATAPEVRTLVT